MILTEALSQVGLNEKESRVYTTLLGLGRATAYAIAAKSGLKRPTVYVVLDDLQRKGAVQRVAHASKQLFMPKSPDSLFREVKQRVNEAERFLPQLLALTSTEKKPRTLYFEGIEGIRQALNYRMEELRGHELVAFAAHAGKVPVELGTIFSEYNNNLRALAVHIRGIAPNHPSLERYRKVDASFGRTVKVIPMSEYSSSIYIEITGSFVRLLAFRDLQALIIENKDIAESLRQIFELAWKGASIK